MKFVITYRKSAALTVIALVILLSFSLQTVQAAGVAQTVPDVAIYVLNDEIASTELNAAALQHHMDNDLPVPAFAGEITTSTSSASFADGGTNLIVPNQLAEGWSVLYDEDFEGEFPYADKGRCQLRLQTKVADENSDDYKWDKDDLRAYNGSSFAGWPAAGGARAVDPQSSTYPERMTSQIICRFTEMAQVHSVMTEFAVWQDRFDEGDKFFVGYRTDTSADFKGFNWLGSSEDEWQARRIYFPDVRDNSGTIEVMWQFQSDNNRHEEARGAWLDNIRVEAYLKPAASANCENTDPQVQVSRAPGDGNVSKGLILPPATEDNTWELGLDPALVTRLQEADTNWVRLEFIQQPSAFIRTQQNGSSAFESIDLKHYDQLIDELCANNIGILGLLTYQTVAEQSWQTSGNISPEYLETYLNITSILVDYFDDRIGVWEVWNEPDFSKSRLTPGSFSELLVEVSQEVRVRGDSVVFGGLGNVDDLSSDYLAQYYTALANNFGEEVDTPFDFFALHPYPSNQYQDASGNLLLDPSRHWSAESPTVFAKFQETLSGGNELDRDDSGKDIWVTEFGWNSAQGSDADEENRCITLEGQWISNTVQENYLAKGFDFLFTDTAWPGEDRQAITKSFWYQYRDTGIPFDSEECTVPPQRFSPSWFASSVWEFIFGPPPEETVTVPWSYGIYDGNFQPKAALCTFQTYPNWVESCYDFDTTVYLPLITAEQVSTRSSR